MSRTTVVVALASALALAVASSASAASRTAYFKVSLVASQDVSWEKHLTFRIPPTRTRARSRTSSRSPSAASP